MNTKKKLDRTKMKMVGRRIRKCHKICKLRDDAMADKLFVAKNTYRCYLQGINPIPSDILLEIAETMSLNMNYIFYGIENDKPFLENMGEKESDAADYGSVMIHIEHYLSHLDKKERSLAIKGIMNYLYDETNNLLDDTANANQ